MENDLNTIDVIIPVYNQGNFISQALDSVAHQTFPPCNIFVVDDGSTDNTRRAVFEYMGKTTLPVNYVYKENGGPNSARNIGLASSKAKFVAFLDADDTWEKNKLEEQLKLFLKSEYVNLGLVYTNYDLIGPEGEKIQGKVVKFDKKFVGNANKGLRRANKILGSASSVLIKREVFEKIGPFDANLKFAEDWDMWLRISERYTVNFVDKVLVHIRKHDKNKKSQLLVKILGKLKFYKKRMFATNSSNH